MNSKASDQFLRSNPWDRFWFQPRSPRSVAWTNALLYLITLLYFADCLLDCTTWFANARPFSGANSANFLRSAGLEAEATWVLSPLFWLERYLGSPGWLFQSYLVVAILACVGSAFGVLGRMGGWITWLLFVGWANRVLFLGGLAEPLLSLGLLGAAVSGPVNAINLFSADGRDSLKSSKSWTYGLASRLHAIHVTLFLICVVISMCGHDVWLHGAGASAFASPSANRLVDISSALEVDVIDRAVSYSLVLLPPVGLLCAAIGFKRWGMRLLLTWAVMVAVLGSMFLFAATCAAMAMTIGYEDSDSEPVCQ